MRFLHAGRAMLHFPQKHAKYAFCQASSKSALVSRLLYSVVHIYTVHLIFISVLQSVFFVQKYFPKWQVVLGCIAMVTKWPCLTWPHPSSSGDGPGNGASMGMMWLWSCLVLQKSSSLEKTAAEQIPNCERSHQHQCIVISRGSSGTRKSGTWKKGGKVSPMVMQNAGLWPFCLKENNSYRKCLKEWTL